MKTSIGVSCLLAALVGLLSCDNQSSPPKTMTEVRVQLKWVHQAQFAGMYVAIEQGYYASEGLEVALLEGGMNIDQADQLRSGAADFAILPAEALLLRNTEKPLLVALAVIYQRNPTVFIARAESGILRPEDLQGKTVAVGKMEKGGFIEGIIQLKAMLNNAGIEQQSIATTDYDPAYSAFLAGKADVTPAYLTGGVIKLQQQGIKLNLIWPGDYGVDTYSDTLAATEDFIAAQPDIVLRFLRATLKGWQTAIEDQETALRDTMKYAKVQDLNIQEAMLDAQIPLIATGRTPIGWMERSVWQQMATLYTELGATTAIPDIDVLHTTVFLETIHRTNPQ